MIDEMSIGSGTIGSKVDSDFAQANALLVSRKVVTPQVGAVGEGAMAVVKEGATGIVGK